MFSQSIDQQRRGGNQLGQVVRNAINTNPGLSALYVAMAVKSGLVLSVLPTTRPCRLLKRVLSKATRPVEKKEV